MTASAMQLYGPDAQAAIHEAVRALKETGFWHAKPARKETVIRVTAAGEHAIRPQDGERVLLLIDTDATIIEEAIDARAAVDIIVGENTHVTYASRTRGRSSVERFAHLAKDASISWIDISDGDDVTGHVVTYLAGEGSDARFASCFLGTQDQRYSVTSNMIHAGNRSTSHMLTRAVLLGTSRGSYDGLIRILPNARGCDAYQRGEFLLLSDATRMHAEPNLEIGNEEVKCSHGVSLSRVDEEQLFYFRARGIRTADARRLIVEGFFADIIDRLPRNAAALKAAIAARIGE